MPFYFTELGMSMKTVANFFRVTMLWVLLLPFLFSFAGAASNQLVLFANGDKFPVMLNAAQIAKAGVGSDGMIDLTHCVMTHETHLNVLADIFDFHTEWDSIGDLLLGAGEWLSTFCFFVWIALVIRRLNER